MPVWTIPVVFGAGLLLLWLEIFLPGGILGVAAGAFLLAGLILVFVNHGVFWGTIATFGLIAVVLIMLQIWMRTFDRSFFGKRLVNRDEVGGDEFIDQLPDLIGQRGTTLSPLSPSGKARINGQKLDVVSQMGVIDKDAEIEVVRVDGISVLVRSIPAQTGD